MNMIKKAHFYINYKNMAVLKDYLDMIKKALQINGFQCDDVINLDGLNKNDLIIFPLGIDAFKFYHLGYRNYILWQQGATADESYMRHKSKLRFSLLNYIDCFAMKKAKALFFCSECMKKHYEELSHCSYSNKSYLMPCFNETLSLQAVENKDYSKKIFTYVGSLDLWQCFDEIAALYKRIEIEYPDAFFKVLTPAPQEAERIICSLGIKNYEVKSVRKEAVQEELKNCVFGFIIRSDSTVNRVATPTKISSYTSVGIIPIFSAVLEDFKKVSRNMKYTIMIDVFFDDRALFKQIDNKIDKEELKKEYTWLYNTYYSKENHIKHAADLLKGILQ